MVYLETIIGTLLTGVLFPLAMYLLNKKTSKKLALKNGYYKLEYSKYYLSFGFICIIVGIGLLSFLADSFSFDFASIFMSVVCSLFIIGGLYISLEILNQQLHYNEKEIIIYNWRKEKIELKFSEIESFKLKGSTGYLILYTRLSKIRVSLLLTGFNQFYNYLSSKQPNLKV